MLTDLHRDAVFAVRTLLKNPGFTLVAIFALAIGIGANTTVYSVVDALIHFPLPVDDPDRISFVFSENPSEQVTQSTASMDDFLEWRAEAGSFDHLVAATGTSYNLVGTGEPVRVQAFSVSSGFFPLWGQELALGRGFRFDENERGRHQVAVLSHSFWQQRFGGSEDVVGQQILLDGDPFTVVGVGPDAFFFPNRNIAMWTPIVLESGSERRDVRNLLVLGRLKAGVSAQEAAPEMETIAKRQERDYPATNEGWTTSVVTVVENFVSGTTLALTLLYGSITFVLLIACANVANLLVARAAAREKEIALRTTLGAGRWRLIRQLLIESFILAGAGGVLGVIIGAWGMTVLRGWLAPDPNVGFVADVMTINSTVLGHALLMSALAAVVFGLVPAIQASRSNLQATLREGGRAGTSTSSRRLRAGLVVAEVAMAMVLLGTSGALIRAFTHIYEADPGFTAENLLTLQIALPEKDYPEPQAIAQFYERAQAALSAVPGVQSVAATSMLPLSLFPGASGEPVIVEGNELEEGEEGPRAVELVVSPGYFDTMEVPILRGRTLTAADIDGGLPVAVVNRTAAERFWPDTEALGRRFQITDETWVTVVGVSGDVRIHMHSVRSSNTRAPAVFLPLAQRPRPASAIALRTVVEPTSLSSSIRQAIWSIDGSLPIDDVGTMQSVIARTDTQNTFFLRVLTALSAIALVLAAVGIYGVISFIVNQRAHEIGIRIALGAEPFSILTMIVRQGATLALTGLAIGVPGAILFVRFMGSELEGIAASNASGGWTYVSVSLLVLVVAKLASFIPARRAVKVDPLVTLRYD